METIVPIICVAIVASLIVLFVIYFKEIAAFLKSKFGNIFKSKSKKQKKESKLKPEKAEKKPTYTVEDFKPVSKNEEADVRDASIERLFAMDDLDFMGDGFLNEPMFPKAPTFEEKPKMNDADKKALDEFFKEDATFKRVKNNINDDKSISKQIKDLSPEMKALMLDNVLKKRDDV